MNEVSLSTDLKQIELEINHHKNIAGQSIWEIGRRLNHVKENDLAHGEFIPWVEHIGFTRQYANRFMKIAKEIPNVNSSLQIGVNKLYLIATLPEEEKLEEITKIEQGRPSTDAELQELKRKLKIAEQDVVTKQMDIDRQSKEIKLLKQQETKVIEQTVEVIPEDYQEIKSNLEFLKKRNDYLEQEQRRLEAERKEVNEKSQKYDELTNAIQQSQGELNRVQQKIADYDGLHKVLKEGNALLAKLSVLVYSDLSDAVANDVLVKNELDILLSRFLKLNEDITKKITNNMIIEGEIIND